MSHEIVWDVDHAECQNCWEAKGPGECPYLAVIDAARAWVNHIGTGRMAHPKWTALRDSVRALDGAQ